MNVLRVCNMKIQCTTVVQRIGGGKIKHITLSHLHYIWFYVI